jgi:hypothetical protein
MKTVPFNKLPFIKQHNNRHLLFYTALLFITSCKLHKSTPYETAGNGITLQVIQLENSPGDANVFTYKARLIPDALLLNEKNAYSKNAMMYKMDSCFYLQSGTKKIYASLVQPIANGVSGTFEYLLEFEAAAGSNASEFVYKDKYLNQKKYSLKLN